MLRAEVAALEAQLDRLTQAIKPGGGTSLPALMREMREVHQRRDGLALPWRRPRRRLRWIVDAS